MMTALVTLARVGLQQEATVSKRAAATGGGGPEFSPGQRLTVEELLEALLVASSNDAAEVLAERVAGSEERFVALMNRAAARLGAGTAHFETPHGLDVPGHVASARDLATIARALLSKPPLALIVRLRSVRVRTAAGVERFENTNLLLKSYSGLIGVKTGYTSGAGNVLVAAARRSGRRLITVAMHSVDAFKDSKVLLDYGWQRLRRTLLVSGGTPVASLIGNESGAVTAVSSAPLRGLHEKDSISLRFVPLATLSTPVIAGSRVGTVEVLARDRVLQTQDAVAERTLAAPAHSVVADVIARILSVGAALIPGTP
jgi:D-alanyl-D-alanine carboxypeptidase (penicillin-binding protein 5/6)